MDLCPNQLKICQYWFISSIYKQPDRHAGYFKCLNRLLWHLGEQFQPLNAAGWWAGTCSIAINEKYRTIGQKGKFVPFPEFENCKK